MDSCEHSPNVLTKWGGVRLNFGGGLTTGGAFSATARHGTKSLNFGDFRNCGRIFDNQQTWILGGAWYLSNHQDGIYTLQDGGFAGTQQIRVYFDAPSASLSVRRGGTTTDGTLLGSYVIPSYSSSQWYFIEFKAFIDNTAGVAVLKVNGNTVINLSGIDSQVSGNAYADTVRYGSSQDGNVNAALCDDIYICDGQTGAGSNPCNDFLGDVRCDYSPADGNGATSDFTGSDGNSTDNYLLVDDATPNEDTDYVQSSTLNQKDTYTLANVTPSAGTVFGIQGILRERKTTAGARSIAGVTRLSGTDEVGPTVSLGTSYEYALDVRETKPGGGDWSITDLNNLEYGPKVVV